MRMPIEHGTLPGLLFAILVAAPADQAAASTPKTAVTLRAAPRVAVAPARVVFTVELKGGDDSEALHCLTLAWTWGDGSTSRSEGDCSPFEAEKTTIQRLFQADHEYRAKGQPSAEVEVLKGERVVGRDSMSLMIGAPKSKAKFEYRRRE